MGKIKYKVTTRFTETENVRRVYGTDVNYDSTTKQATPGYAIIVNDIEFNESRASIRYSDETMSTVVGVAIKEFERI